MSFGKAWLFYIAPASWRPSSGERVAMIGPLPIRRRYLLGGAQCLRTPSKTFVIHARETGFVPGDEPMVLKPAGTETRHSLALHDASLPWRPKLTRGSPQTQYPQ